MHDHEMLRAFARTASETVFATLVERYVGLVYSAALRQVRNPHHAEDITQAVFIVLARKAASLPPDTILAGWLLKTTRYTANAHIRATVRRAQREEEAAMQSTLNEPDDVIWEQLSPHLDEAMTALGEADRNAIALRYFANRPWREVAGLMQVTEDAAQKRVARALEKLRKLFAKRGLTLTVALVAGTISANSVQAAPAGMAAKISAAALAGTVATTATIVATKTIAMTTLQKTLVTAAVVVLTGAAWVATWVATNRGHGKNVAGVAQLTGDSSKPELAAQTPAAPPGLYSIESISVPPTFAAVHVNSFNNQGQVVGSLEGSNGVVHAFVWDHGVMTDLETLGGSKAIACSINDLGEITAIVLTNEQRRILFLQTNGTTDLGAIDGFAKLGPEGNIYYAPSVSVNNRSEVTCRLTVEDGNQRSFLFQQGKISYFGLRGDGRVTDTRAMNNQGDIAGVSIPGNDGWGVFMWHDGKMTDLKTLGGPRAGANAMNDHGTIVGWANPAGATWDQAHAIVWENGELHDLNAAGWKNSRATGINNAGDLVGWAATADNRTLAFLKRGEKIFDLNDLIPTNSGWRIVGVSAINERGQMLALARKDGQSRSVIISPPDLQPEPATKPAVVSHSGTTLTPPSQPKVTAFGRLPNGAFHLRFNGQPGVKYVIEASTNLTTWNVLGETANQNGQLEFTDQDAPNFPLRFYRVAKP